MPTSPVPASPRRFRLRLLDIFGAMTLSCIAVALVVSLPSDARDDRIFLATVLAGLTSGILLGRGLGGRGVLFGTLGATLAAAGVMVVF